jgi:hypothetical protein
VAVQVARLPLEAARVVPAVVAQALRKPGRPVVPAVFPHRRLYMLQVLPEVRVPVPVGRMPDMSVSRLVLHYRIRTLYRPVGLPPAVVAQALRKPRRPVVPAVFPHRRLCMLPVLLPAVVVRGFRMPDS